ncbi:MAG: hypothetical protein A2104_09125 [Candidatus Melainabacteria bacterium GWF2_32_7]|nr:MAG: hypothetical protein A2104_09125 [Candidatus Melainabacteria bacterium GWF2_32_7]
MNSIEHQPNKKAVGVLSIGHLISDAYGGFILPIMPLIAIKLGLSLAIVGLLHAISSLASSILQPLFGYVSDMINRRLFIIWGIIFSAIFISLTGLTTNIWTLGTVIFLGSMGVGLFHPQATSYAGHYSGIKINKYMGAFTAFGTIGFALGPFISSILVENFGLQSTVYAIIPGIIILYCLYTMVPKRYIKTDHHPRKEINFAKLFSLKRILFILLFIAVIRSIVVASFDVFMPFLWTKYNISVIFIGTLIGLFSFLGGIASYIGGRLSDTIDRRTIMVISLIPAIPCLLGSLLLLQNLPIISFVLFVLAGFLIMSSTSVNLVIGQTAIPENAGLVSGIIGGFSWGIAGLLLSPIGFLATKYGIATVLTVIAFIPILGAVSTAYIPKEYS